MVVPDGVVVCHIIVIIDSPQLSLSYVISHAIRHRTQQHASFSKCQDDHLLCRSWNNFTGFLFVNELTTNLQFSHIKHTVHPHCHTLAITSDLGNLLVISAHPLHRYCTSQSPEPSLLIMLSVAQHPLFGTLATDTSNSCLLTVFKFKLKTHIFCQTFNHSN